MAARRKTYQVVGTNPVMVEYADGNAVSYPVGSTFQADPTSRCVVRLLRNHLIREVSARELPNSQAR